MTHITSIARNTLIIAAYIIISIASLGLTLLELLDEPSTLSVAQSLPQAVTTDEVVNTHSDDVELLTNLYDCTIDELMTLPVETLMSMDSVTPEVIDYHTMTYTQLRDHARTLGIKGRLSRVALLQHLTTI